MYTARRITAPRHAGRGTLMQDKGMSETERARLESLASYNILDSAPEHEYDDIENKIGNGSEIE